jgi:hypothetical protein
MFSDIVFLAACGWQRGTDTAGGYRLTCIAWQPVRLGH